MQASTSRERVKLHKSRASLAQVKKNALREVTLRYHHSSSLAVAVSCVTVKELITVQIMEIPFRPWFGSVSFLGHVVVIFDRTLQEIIQECLFRVDKRNANQTPPSVMHAGISLLVEFCICSRCYGGQFVCFSHVLFVFC